MFLNEKKSFKPNISDFNLMHIIFIITQSGHTALSFHEYLTLLSFLSYGGHTYIEALTNCYTLRNQYLRISPEFSTFTLFILVI